MGNGIPFNMLCCNQNINAKKQDVDINKNTNDYFNDFKAIQISNNNINKDEKLNNNQLNINLNKKKSLSIYSENDGKKILAQGYRRDSLSYKDPNISLFNNTFQILNNTQQYISFSNMNFYKNNITNNQLFKPNYNSKFQNSAIYFSKINSNIEFNILDIKTKLILTGELFLNKEIEIDKFGMKNSLRQRKDGVIIFGYKDENNNSNSPLYDYLIEIKSEKINNISGNNNHHHKKKNIGEVFEIILDKKEKGYILYYRHSSLLLYYKISDSLFFEIDKDYYLILGDIFLTINVKKSLNSNEKIINFQVEIEDEKPKKYSYEKKDVPIKIGRSNCTINISKPSISKLHSTIDYLNDMFVYNDKKSTNGSTLLIKEDDVLKIKGEMNFKLEDIPFKIKEVMNDDIK